MSDSYEHGKEFSCVHNRQSISRLSERPLLPQIWLFKDLVRKRFHPDTQLKPTGGCVSFERGT
jgi:hypothetical protein